MIGRRCLLVCKMHGDAPGVTAYYIFVPVDIDLQRLQTSGYILGSVSLKLCLMASLTLQAVLTRR